uniref:Uncharacterized protein n=1 Tax=Prymnesium polylepis TaxID=72548 RepID=A0A7S4IMY5_9EUKA
MPAVTATAMVTPATTATATPATVEAPLAATALGAAAATVLQRHARGMGPRRVYRAFAEVCAAIRLQACQRGREPRRRWAAYRALLMGRLCVTGDAACGVAWHVWGLPKKRSCLGFFFSGSGANCVVRVCPRPFPNSPLSAGMRAVRYGPLDGTSCPPLP